MIENGNFHPESTHHELPDPASTEGLSDVDELEHYIRSEARELLGRIDNDALDRVLDAHTDHQWELEYYMAWLRRINMSPLSMLHDTPRSSALRSEAVDTYATLVMDAQAFLEDMAFLQGDVQSSMDMWSPDDGEFGTAAATYDRYRPVAQQLTPPQAHRKLYVPAHDWLVNPDDEQRSALTRHLRQLDVYREVARLSIEGLELLRYPLSEAQLRQFLCGMPALALEGVEGIRFKHAADEGEESGEDKYTAAVHDFSPRNNIAHIDVYVDPLNAIFESMESGSEGIENIVYKNSIQRCVAHEVGHALHTQLPVALLHEWDRAIKPENTFGITEYVASVHATGDEKRHSRERFADTFAQFYNHLFPDRSVVRLAEEAPAHFEAMLAILRQTGAVDFPKE